MDETKSRQQKPKSTKQKLNRKNQKRTIIIAENKNLNFNYLSIKENTKHRTEMENNKLRWKTKKIGKKRRKKNEEETKATKNEINKTQ